MKRSLLVGFCMFLAVAAFAQETAREVFQQAESRFQSGDYEVALQRYEALVRDYPFSEYVPDAQFRRAVVMYRLQRYETALSLLRRVEARYRSTRFLSLVPFWKGVALYRLGEYPEAERELERFLDSSARETLRRQAWLYHALTMLASDRRQEAVVSLETLFSEIDLPESEPYALSLLLSLYIRDEAYPAAVSLFDEVDAELVDEQWRSNARLYGAEALRAVGREEEALEIFLDLTDEGPAVSATAFRRAYELSQRLGRSETAREVVRNAEQSLSGRTDVLAELWTQVGTESYRAGRVGDAELYLSRAWELEEVEVPDTVPLYLAEIYAEQDRIGDAVRVLREARDRGLGEYGDRILLREGNLELERREPLTAVETIDEFLAQYPSSDYRAEGEYLRAFSLYRLGRNEEALAQARETLTSGRAGDYERELLWLRSLLHRRLGEPDAAVQSLREYLTVARDDVDARLELVKLLFEQGRYDEAIRQSDELLEDADFLEREEPGSYVQLRYVEGLSHVALKEYGAALSALDELPREPVVYEALADDGGDLLVMHPYALYYQGWANYRLSRYEEAEGYFSGLLSYDDDHEFAPRAAYLAGWSAFNRGAQDAAAGFLRRAVSLAESEEVRAEATLLLGRSLKAVGAYAEADARFRNIFADAPRSDLADDALFEYAEGLERRGRTDEAVERYRVLFERYPESPLAEEGMYRRAEVLFQEGRFAAARQAFFEYRANYPDGSLIASALYWGGVSAYEIGEVSGALLLWETLIEDHRESAFRADAMQRAAEVYSDRGDYRRALNLYSRLVATYPRQAEAVGAADRIDELLLRIGGLSEREARLWVRIEQNDRSQTAAGRRAILDAARLSIREGSSGVDRENLIVPLLRATAGKEDEDPAAAAEAYMLLGEYHLRQSRPREAREAFLNAAAADPSDRNRTAEALYRATEASVLADRVAEAQSIVDRLESSFPQSEWTAEARRLIEEAR
jgi:cellulose synthase operon protein C